MTRAAANTAVTSTQVSRFDDAGRTTGTRDGLGGWSTLSLTVSGIGASAINAAGQSTRTVFNLAGEVTDSFDEQGRQTHHERNERGWVTLMTNAQGESESWGFDEAGNQISYTDINNETWLKEYDELNRLAETTDPEGRFTQTTWWDDGRVKDVIVGQTVGQTTTSRTTRHDVSWADLERTVTEGYGTALARTVTETFNEVGFVTQIEDALGHKQFYVADDYHRLEQVKNHDQVVIAEYTRDDVGNVLTFEDGEGEVTEFGYDALNRQVQVIDPNGDITRTLLNANGQAVGTVNGLGELLRTSFSLLGEETLSVDALGGVTRREYDAAHNLLSLTDPVGNTTRWGYDEMGRKIGEVDPLGNSRSWTYNEAGQLFSYTDFNGRYKQYEYFDDGMLKKETWKTTPTGTTVNEIEYTYNAFGQPLTISDNSGTYTFTYDDLGRRATQTDPHGLTLTWAYDDADRVETVTDSEGGVRSYEYDDNDRVTAISFDDGTSELRIEYDYNNRNQVEEIRRYDDAVGTTLVSKTLLGYDDAGRVNSIHHKDASNATINHIQYQHDEAGRVTQETSTLGPTKNYAYDLTGQLVDDGTEEFEYDLNGNRASFDIGIGNQLQSDGTWDYVYDDEGNVIGKEHSGTGEMWIYAFDHNNRLIEAEHKDSSSGPVDLRVAFSYDVFGNRIEKSVDADGDGSGTATVEKFAYEDRNAWADLDDQDSLTTRRLYEIALDAVFARIGAGQDEDWYLKDNLGSVRDIIDFEGTHQDHIDYKSFGAVDSESDPGYGDRLKFTARDFDPETGLQNNRDRYYQVDVGAWMSRDPIGFAGGTANLYEYVGNTPTTFTDPTGLFPEWEGFIGAPIEAWRLGLDLTDLSSGRAHWVALGARSGFLQSCQEAAWEGGFWAGVGQFGPTSATWRLWESREPLMMPPTVVGTTCGVGRGLPFGSLFSAADYAEPAWATGVVDLRLPQQP